MRAPNPMSSSTSEATVLEAASCNSYKEVQ